MKNDTRYTMHDQQPSSDVTRYTLRVARLLLVGLGNPGDKYSLNRHNAGFMFLDWLLKEKTDMSPGWKFDKYSDSEIAKMTLQTRDSKLITVISKPQTFMNRSGEAVHQLITKFPFSHSDNLHDTRYTLHDLRYTICVVHDDLDIRLGNFKIQKGIGPKQHNGLESIESSLKTKDFWRVRIGIDNRDSDYEGSGEGYVLSNFENEELTVLNSVFSTTLQQLIHIVSS